ncbi:hypothetical protein D1794_01875 [Streptomyces clavuligerus]|nr:hypothetical protein D1794_01875 [Streptomyces clavuligerus]
MEGVLVDPRSAASVRLPLEVHNDACFTRSRRGRGRGGHRADRHGRGRGGRTTGRPCHGPSAPCAPGRHPDDHRARLRPGRHDLVQRLPAHQSAPGGRPGRRARWRRPGR